MMWNPEMSNTPRLKNKNNAMAKQEADVGSEDSYDRTANPEAPIMAVCNSTSHICSHHALKLV